mmetsp:Transcript_11064/g.29711  ORF Transcript_11064/g.29711 Transcript_11064/m.29711 type:complete len:149 (+) Transcript_11064:94-540(+)
MASPAKKAIKIMIKMSIDAGKAAPSPPVGPRLGQLGLPIMQFCKEFNERTKHFLDGVPVNTRIIAYEDRTYQLDIYTPPTSYFIKRCAGLEKGANSPGREIVGKISTKMVYEIARYKKTTDPKMKDYGIYGICKMIVAQSRNMGIEVE